MAQKYDFCINRGTDFQCLFVCFTGIGDALLMNGFTAKMQIKQVYAAKPIDELSTENGRLEIDVDNAVIKADFPHEVTSQYPPVKLLYDILLTSDDGHVFRLLEGTITVRPGVTK